MLSSQRLSITLLAAALGAAPLAAQGTYTNPILDSGADPEVVFDGGTWWIFYTDIYSTARRSSADGFSGWSEKTIAYEGTKDRQGWAPSFRHEAGTWYLYTAGALSTAPSLGDTFTFLRQALAFDPQYFRAADGRHLFIGGGSHAGHFVAEMVSPTALGPKTALYFLPGTGWSRTWEGLYVQPVGGRFYLFLSAGSANSIAYRLHYATADSLEGPWTLAADVNDAAFLRQSDHESIVGPGHHTMITDAHGTFWIYYQQHNDSGGHYNRSIAVDPMWIDASGVPHMRPTRGIAGRPGPGSDPALIWPAIAASARIEAETYHGSRCNKLGSGGSGMVVQDFRQAGFVAYRKVDFGAGLAAFSARVANGNSGTNASSLEVRLDGAHGPVVGVLPVPATGDWSAYQTLEIPLARTVAGVHDIVLVANGAAISQESLRLDWFTFTPAAPGHVVTPPTAQPDHGITATGTPLVLAILANDHSASGGKLAIASAGSETAANRSVKSTVDNLAVLPDGTVAYTPPPDYWGADEFFYSLADGSGAFARGWVRIEVRPPATAVFAGGSAVIEAEDFIVQRSNKDTVAWERSAALPGGSGSGYVVTPDLGTAKFTGETGGTPAASQLDYAVVLPAGLHHVWARVRAPDTEGNDAALFFSTASDLEVRADVNQGWRLETKTTGEWVWVRLPHRISVNAGLIRFGVRRGRDGLAIDRFLITDDPALDPAARAATPAAAEPARATP